MIFLCSLFFLVQGASNDPPLQPSDRSAILDTLHYHYHCIVTWHLLAANSKFVENFEPSSEYSLYGDNKEKLFRNVRSEYASDSCHDRKSACSLSHLSLQPLPLVQGASNVSPLQPSNRSAILNILNCHCHCIVTWHLRIAN